MSEFKVNELISWRVIDGQILILDSHLNESAHELNEVGSFIFSKISEGSNLENIKEELVKSYPENNEIEADFQTFIDELKNLKLIVPS